MSGLAGDLDAQRRLHEQLAPEYVERYRHDFSRRFQKAWHMILAARLGGTGPVLDMGCGTGFLLADLEASFPVAVGLDLSEDMLGIGLTARSGGDAPRLLCGDAQRLPVLDGALGGVVAKGSLHHVRDHASFLSEAVRVLAPGGRFVISEPCNDAPWIRLARWVMYRLNRGFDPGDEGFTTRRILELMREAGFRVESVEKFGVFAYVLAGFPDHLPFLKWIPFAEPLTRFLIRIDSVLTRFPPTRILGFHVIITAGRAAG